MTWHAPKLQESHTSHGMVLRRGWAQRDFPYLGTIVHEIFAYLIICTSNNVLMLLHITSDISKMSQKKWLWHSDTQYLTLIVYKQNKYIFHCSKHYLTMFLYFKCHFIQNFPANKYFRKCSMIIFWPNLTRNKDHKEHIFY